MVITRVYYKHFKCFEDYEFTPGKLTIIRGKNRAGKSSLLNGIQSIIEGGHNARLIQDGHEEAIVGIVFDTGDEVIKTITADKYDIDVTKSDPLDDKPPMTWVRSVFSRFAVNPTKYILSTDKKEREQWLLEAMPIETSLEELQACIGELSEVDEKYGSMPALKAIDSLHDLVYKHRRDHNRIVDEKEKTKKQLFSSTPTDYIEEESLAEHIKINEDSLEEMQTTMNNGLANIDRLLEERIQKLRDSAKAAKQQIRDNSQPKIDELKGRIATLRNELKNAGAINASVNLLLKTEQEILDLRKRSQLYDAAITRLRQLRQEKLESIPIEGVEIRDGELYKDGLHFDDQLNTEQKIDLVMRIALLHADRQKSKVKLIMLDDAEHLDLEHQQAMIDWVKKLKRKDVHFIMAEVDRNAPNLTIENVIE